MKVRKLIESINLLRLVIFKWALGTGGWAIILSVNLSSSVIIRFLGGPSSARAAARDASSIFLVASSMARDAASMAIASRSV